MLAQNIEIWFAVLSSKYNEFHGTHDELVKHKLH